MKGRISEDTVNIVNLYISEINEYPLLEKDDEVKFFKLIENPENKKLLAIDEIIDGDPLKENGEKRQWIEKYYYYHLNIDILFKSLSKIKSYDKAIESLLKLYYKLNLSDKKDIELIEKYMSIAKVLGRPLNISELKKYFNIDVNAEILDPSTLATEIKSYKLFKYAYNELYTRNLRLTIPVVKRYYSNKLDFLDMVNQGNLGILKAIDGFKLSKNTRFSTYATPWIEAKIGRYVRENKEVIRVPEYIQYEIKKYKEEARKIQKQRGRQLSLKEISEELGISLSKLRLYLQVDSSFLSLDQPVNDESDSASLMDFIPDDSSLDDMYKKMLENDIEILYNYLNAQEIDILKMYFSIGEYRNEKHTFRSIGQKYNVTHSCIDQKFTRAKFKLMRVAHKDEKVKALRDYL